jgi:hypothetical protein
MSAITHNPHVDMNNARNLPAGTVLDRPTGELQRLWRAYADLLDRETRKKRQSNRKHKRKPK